jgi:thiol:disulfide interchange protein DsbD
MKLLFLVFVNVLILGVGVSGQKQSPVSWSFELVRIDGENFELKATAVMQKSWVIYSQFTDDGGPIPTIFLVDGVVMQLDEKSKVIKEFDDMFDVNVMKFKESAVFTKKINKDKNKSGLTGSVEYMTCDGTRCLPPAEVKFELKY